MAELALSVPGPMPEAEGPEDDMEETSEALMALEEAMPKAKPVERDAMKRAIEACVAEFMGKGGGY